MPTDSPISPGQLSDGEEGRDTDERRPLLSPDYSAVQSRPLDKGVIVQRPRFSVVRARMVTVAVVMLTGASFGPLMSLLSQYLEHRLGKEKDVNSTNNNGSVCNLNTSDPQVKAENQLQAEVSTSLMYYSYMATLPAIFTSLIIGSYSDFVGRKFSVLYPVTCAAVKGILISCIIRFDMNLNFFYLAFGIDGMYGGLLIILMAIYTITADINEDTKERVLWITIITALCASMMAASNIAMGYIIEYSGFFSASLLLMSAMALASILSFLFLQETYPPPEVKVLNLAKNVKRVFGFYLYEGTLRKRLTLILCMVMFFCAVITDLAVPSIDALYQIHEPFCWDSKLIGYYGAFKTGGMYLIGMFLMKILQCCCRHEYVGMLASFCQGSSYILETFAQTTWQLFLVPAVGTPGSLITPVLRSTMSLLAGPANQGALFTSICVFENLCNAVSVTVFNKVYALTVDSFPGTVYLCMAAFNLTTFLLFFLYFRIREQDHDSTDKEITVPEPVAKDTDSVAQQIPKKLRNLKDNKPN